MAHRLNTNKQFMIGNGIMAFAVIFVVVIFVYLSLRANRERGEGERYYRESYTVTLVKGFLGDSVSIYINDSLLLNQTIRKEPIAIETDRFAEQNALMIVDNLTEKLALFELSEEGGSYLFEKKKGEVQRLEAE